MSAIGPYDIDRSGIQDEDDEEDFNEFWETGLLVFIGRLPANHAPALIGNHSIGQSRCMIVKLKPKPGKSQQTAIVKMFDFWDVIEH